MKNFQNFNLGPCMSTYLHDHLLIDLILEYLIFQHLILINLELDYLGQIKKKWTSKSHKLISNYFTTKYIQGRDRVGLVRYISSQPWISKNTNVHRCTRTYLIQLFLIDLIEINLDCEYLGHKLKKINIQKS